MNWPKRLKQETTDAIRYSFSSLGSLDRERFNVVDQRVLDCDSQYFPGDANRHRLAQRDVDVGARVGVHHCGCRPVLAAFQPTPGHWRSEEHTSELQSRGHLVCRLLLEKKKSPADIPHPQRNDTDTP